MRFSNFVPSIVLACASLGPALPAESEADGFERSKAAITEVIVLGGDNRSRCEREGKSVRYSGRTDLGLYTCLYAAAQDGAEHLIITSFGGPVVNAIPSADIIARQKMSVSILGVCASSCGNYIAPAAAELNVLPFSIWSVHGAPLLVNEDALRDAMTAAGASEEQVERSLSSNVQLSRYEVALHAAFKARHGIRNGLYDAAQLHDAQERLGEGPMLYLSRDTAEDCAPALSISAYWQVSGADDEKALQRLFPDRSIGEYGALTEGRVCRQGL